MLESPGLATPKIQGVWKVESFDLQDDEGNTKPWCKDSYGILIYAEQTMSVAINCNSNPEKMLFYAGKYEIKENTVYHYVQNFSDIFYHQTFPRKIEMPNLNQLNLVGSFGSKGKAVLSFIRQEGKN